MPFCVNCGKKIELNTEKCPDCGEIILPYKKTIPPTEKDADKKSIEPIPQAASFKRIISGIFDLSISVGLTLMAWFFIIKRMAATGTKIRWLIFKLILPFLPALYLVFKDSLGGKSFGKMIFGLTTINIDKAKPANFTDSLLRNAIMAIVAIPVLGWIAFSVIAVFIGIQIAMGKPRRLGDDFAKTMVIEDKYLDYLSPKNE